MDGAASGSPSQNSGVGAVDCLAVPDEEIAGRPRNRVVPWPFPTSWPIPIPWPILWDCVPLLQRLRKTTISGMTTNDADLPHASFDSIEREIRASVEPFGWSVRFERRQASLAFQFENPLSPGILTYASGREPTPGELGDGTREFIRREYEFRAMERASLPKRRRKLLGIQCRDGNRRPRRMSIAFLGLFQTEPWRLVAASGGSIDEVAERVRAAPVWRRDALSDRRTG